MSTQTTESPGIEGLPFGVTPEERKPVFVPLLHNGNGSVMANFMMCHAAAFAELGLPVKIVAIGDSHAGRGMNKTAADFLASECDVWINIDADVLFSARDVRKLIERDAELLYGLYPKKSDEADACVCTFADGPIGRPDGLTEVRRSGRGFMRVTRSLLERMKEENGGHAKRFYNHGEPQWEFFESGVVTGDMSAMEGGVAEWLSEDWYFCERARQLGVPTLVDTTIALMHEGSRIYRFPADRLQRLDITEWREIKGWFSDEDAEAYRAIAEAIPADGEMAEIGTWMGRSLGSFVGFCRELGKKPKIHAVDTFKGTANETEAHAAEVRASGGSVRHLFERNMRSLGLNGELTIHEEDSYAASFEILDGTLDAVFIDGDHSCEGASADISAWLPKVKPGGIIAGHDADYPEVQKAIAACGINSFDTIGRCWLHQKTA